MIIVAMSLWLFSSEVGVSTFLPTPTPPKIPSDRDSTALVYTQYCIVEVLGFLSDIAITIFLGFVAVSSQCPGDETGCAYI
jgi:hypothetical protein